jgi:hypothetical protein
MAVWDGQYAERSSNYRATADADHAVEAKLELTLDRFTERRR